MQFLIPLAINLDDEQFAAWARAIRLHLPASDEDAGYHMRAHVLASVSAEFRTLGVRATVTIDRPSNHQA